MSLITGYVRSTQHHKQHQVDIMDSLKALLSPSSVLFSFTCLLFVFTCSFVSLLILYSLPVVCLSYSLPLFPILFLSVSHTAHCDELVNAGVHYDSASEQYQVGVTARKNFQLGSSETWLKLSQDALYNPQTQKVHSQPCWHNMSGT